MFHKSSPGNKNYLNKNYLFMAAVWYNEFAVKHFFTLQAEVLKCSTATMLTKNKCRMSLEAQKIWTVVKAVSNVGINIWNYLPICNNERKNNP